MLSRNQYYDDDDDPEKEVELSRYVTPLNDDPGGDDYPEYTNPLEDGHGYDYDDEPLGDVDPYSGGENSGIVHNGRYYAPLESTDDYDMYQADVTPDFDDTTTNREQYGWKTAPSHRHEVEDYDEPTQELPRFTAETTNRSTYLPHIVKKTSATKREAPLEKVPFYGETTQRVNYTPKSTLKPQKQRPKTHLGPGDNKFDNDTVHKSTYVPVAAERPARYMANDHLGVGGEFFAKTTHADEFQKHEVKKPQRRKQSASKLQPGVIDDLTTTRQVYTPKRGEKDCVAAKMLAAHKHHKLAGSHFTDQGHLMIPRSAAIKNGAKASQFEKPAQVQRFNPAGHNQNTKKTVQEMPKPSFDIYEVSSHGSYTPPPVVFSPFAGIQPHPTNDSPTFANYGRNEHVYSTRQRPTAHSVATHPNQQMLGFPIAK
uniref:ZM domain-containing protein n=1 Tax=Panagrellus redivivus TaxID=6233 RepID=A0A7E4W0X3_PANRE